MVSKRKTTTRAGEGLPNKPKSAAQAILPAKMPKGNRVRVSPADEPEPWQPPDEHTVTMRKIANGHIIRQHGYESGKRFETEHFSETKPTVSFEKAKRAARLAGKVI